MRVLDDVSKYFIGFPFSLQNTDWLLVFESNRKFINGAHSAAAEDDCVSQAREKKVSACVPSTRIENKVVIIQGQGVALYVLVLGLCRRYAYHDTPGFFASLCGPIRESGRGAGDENPAACVNFSPNLLGFFKCIRTAMACFCCP